MTLHDPPRVLCCPRCHCGPFHSSLCVFRLPSFPSVEPQSPPVPFWVLVAPLCSPDCALEPCIPIQACSDLLHSPLCIPQPHPAHLVLLCSCEFPCQIPSSPSLHPPFPSILPNTYPDPSIPSLCTEPDTLLSPWCMLRPLCSALCLLRSLLLPNSTLFLGRLLLSPVPSILHGQSLKGHAPEPTAALQEPFSRPVQLPPCNLEDISWPKDCSEIPTSSRSGVYIIQPKGLHPIVVSCEMNVTNGGWTVIQRNQRDTAVTWAESWSTYKYGFGSVHSEYWLGTEYIHQISKQKVYQVRFVIQDSTGKINFSDYNLFSVEDESHGYRLRLGAYSGTAGDAMTSDNPTTMHDNMKFSTKDRDQDTYSKNCAYSYEGGWWYSACYSVRLNFKGGMTWEKLHATNFHILSASPQCLVKHPNKFASLSSFSINEHLFCISEVLPQRPRKSHVGWWDWTPGAYGGKSLEQFSQEWMHEYPV
uniref:Fibrinogen C-terminal domain-containing protein n=1 Tax=Otus sunia TaxID=257818 RepID=A0A8C8BL99_9STRI